MGQTSVMSLLLEHGANIDSRDPCGRTPLFSCAAFGSVGATRLLLQRGADENAKDDRGEQSVGLCALCVLNCKPVLGTSHSNPK